MSQKKQRGQQSNQSTLVEPHRDALSSDVPLTDPEKDKLGRREFANHLASAVLQMSADDGFVLALNGPWGSGKTTIVNFALSYLRAESSRDKLVVVQFNPWWFSGREQLFYQFFQQFAASLDIGDVSEALKGVGGALDVFSRLLGPAALIPGFGTMADAAKSLAAQGADALRSAGEAAAHDVQGRHGAISEALRSQETRIVVVMDDIDRLQPEEIRQVFQLVKAVANFPKTIYLLVFDENVVVRALNDKTSELGQDYLEKIVQLSLDVPIPDRASLRSWLFKELDTLLQDTPDYLWDPEQWTEVYFSGIDPLIRTPRDVKRFVNALAPTYAIARGEVHAVDFLALQALRVFAPAFYRSIPARKASLAGADIYDDALWTRPELQKKAFDLMLHELSEPTRQQAAGAIMRSLFPEWLAAQSGSTNLHMPRSEAKWRRERRIRSSHCFDTYFRLTLLPGQVSRGEIDGILAVANEPETLATKLIHLVSLVECNGMSRLHGVLEQLVDLTDEIPVEQIEPILTAIHSVGDQLLRLEDEGGLSAPGNDSLLEEICLDLVKRLPSREDRGALLKRVFAQSKAIGLMCYQVAMLDRELGRLRGSAPIQEDRHTVTAEHLDEFEMICVSKIEQAATDGSLARTPRLCSTFYRWADWGSKDRVHDYAAQLAGSDEGFCDYVSGCLQRMGSTKRAWIVYSKSVLEFLESDRSALKVRCESILDRGPGWLTDRRRLGLESLLFALNNPDADR